MILSSVLLTLLLLRNNLIPLHQSSNFIQSPSNHPGSRTMLFGILADSFTAGVAAAADDDDVVVEQVELAVHEPEPEALSFDPYSTHEPAPELPELSRIVVEEPSTVVANTHFHLVPVVVVVLFHFSQQHSLSSDLLSSFQAVVVAVVVQYPVSLSDHS